MPPPLASLRPRTFAKEARQIENVIVKSNERVPHLVERGSLRYQVKEMEA